MRMDLFWNSQNYKNVIVNELIPIGRKDEKKYYSNAAVVENVLLNILAEQQVHAMWNGGRDGENACEECG